MIKRILMLILAAVMIMSTTAFGAFSDVDYNSEYGKAIEALTEAGILSGYGNGEFGSKDNLTRAQFAKIVVVTSGREESAKSKNTEVFTDVSSSHWAIGYINEASSLGLITGYPNGSFGADEKITYAQALTIIIRMLGYTESEVGANWPNDYINKASELGITKGMNFGRNEYLTREAAAYIVYNSLSAKSGSAADSFDVKKIEDVIIYGDNSVNQGIGTNQVLTTAGTFKKGTGYKNSYLGKEVVLRVNKDNEIVMITPKSQEYLEYTAVMGDTDGIETVENGKVKINSSRVTYYKGAKGTYYSIASEITFGSKVYIYDDYIYIEEKKETEVIGTDAENLKKAFGNEKVTLDYEWLNASGGEVLKKHEDVVVYGDNSINSGIASGEVLTTAGTFKKGNIYNSGFLGKEVDLFVNSDNEIVVISEKNQEFTVHTATFGSYSELETIESGTLKIESDSIVYHKGTKNIYLSVGPEITFGSKVYIYDDYIYIEEKKEAEALRTDAETLKKVFGKEKVSVDYEWFNTSGGEVLKKQEDVVIYGDNTVNPGIATDEVLTTAGTVKKGNTYSSEFLGKEVDLFLNSDNEIVAIAEKNQLVTVYTAILGSNDELETIENGTVDIDSLSVVYYKGSKGNFYDKGTTISFGSKVYIYDDYIYVEEKKNDSVVAEEELIKEAFGSEDVAIDYEWLKGSKGEYLTKYEDVIIYGTNSNNSSVSSEYVMTTSGLIKKGNIFNDEFLGKKVELRVNSKVGIIAIIPDSEVAREYTLLSAYSDKIETKEDGIKEIDGKISVYYDGSAATYNDIYGKITPGCKIYMYEDYMYIEENELIGPYTITKDYTEVYEFFGDIGEVGVTIDGETTTVSDIEKYDVVYYNDKTARIYAYSQKVTGIYEKAMPSKSNLTGIQLSGVSYNALSADAIKKLDDTLGAFKINDRITLLFGHDGTVVDVIDIDGRTLDDMGVLLRSYSAISKEGDTLGKNEHFAEIMLASGNTVTYKTDKIYNDEGFDPYIGKFVYITNKGNGIVKLELAKENKLTGSFDKSVPSYAGHKLQQNYSILELVHSEKYGEAVVRKVNLKDISVSSLSAEDIIHVEYANSMEDIALIYVNNITYDGYTFGVLNKATSDDDANYTYELKSSGGTTTYTGNAGWSFVKGEAVMVLVKNNKIRDIKELVEIASVSGIEDYTDTRIKVNGKVYEMDENVSVVLKSIGDSDYNITTISDFEENVESGLWKIGSVSVYADKRTNGKVRVIRISLK